MRKIALSFAFSALLGCAPALADWTGKDASGATITFKNSNPCSSVVCVPIAQPVDGTGAAFGVTANPFYVAPAAGATFPAGQGNAGSNGQAWWMRLGDGTNGPAAVKPASTAPAAADPALVVVLSPNGAQATAANQASQLTQETATAAAMGTTADAPCTLPATTTACSQIALAKAQANSTASSIPAGTAIIGATVPSDGTNKTGAFANYGTAPTGFAQGVNAYVTNPQSYSSQYPSGATPITASATGTTAATTATLAGTTGKTTYICSLSIRSNATAAATGNGTVTGTITGTLNFTHWSAPAASGVGITEQIYSPCVPASAQNTGIAVASPAPGAGGVVSVSATGYQL